MDQEKSTSHLRLLFELPKERSSFMLPNLMQKVGNELERFGVRISAVVADNGEEGYFKLSSDDPERSIDNTVLELVREQAGAMNITVSLTHARDERPPSTASESKEKT